MTPKVRRIRGICRSEMFRVEKPLTRTRPALGSTSPVSSLMMVDLPEPEGPTRKTNSPGSIRREIPRMALVPLSYSISTSFNSMRALSDSSIGHLQMASKPGIRAGQPT